VNRKQSQEHDTETASAKTLALEDASEDSWPDTPTFEEMRRIVQERLAGPDHDARVEQLRRHEERWAAMSEQERRACFPDDLVGMIDDPSFPRSTHLHEDLYGEGTNE
jgi:hypothetical protein